MQEWRTYRIGDICKRVCSGGTPKSTEPSYYDGEIPWLNTKEINFNRISSTEKHITQSGLDNSSAKWIDKNSVIVAMYGATAAKVAINTIPLTTNQACCNLSIDETKADYRFVYYWLCSHYTELASLANGGAQQNLNAQQIKDFEIKLPEIQIQQKIADLLWSIDNKIICNKSINDNLEQQAQALYKSWFVDFEPFKNGKFVDSEQGLIPEGWRIGEFSEICDIVGGGTPSKSRTDFYCKNGIAWLTPKDLSVSKAKFTAKGAEDITLEGYNSSSAKLMPRGAVLFSSRAPIGYITIAKNEISTNQGFKSAVPRIAGTGYLYYYLKSNISTIESKASGSTFKEASGALMKSLKVIVPPTQILNDFEKEIDALFRKQELLDDEIINLAIMRDTLLPKLMSGELTINEIDC